MHGAHSREERSKNTFTYCTNVVSVDRLLAAATTSLAALSFRHDNCIVWIAFAFDDATKNEKNFCFFLNRSSIVPVMVMSGLYCVPDSS